MNWIEQLALTVVLGILQGVIKSPSGKTELGTVLQHVRDDACEACLAINPSVPPPPGYVAAP